MAQTLDVVPNSVIDREGAPRYGSFRGELPAVDLREARSGGASGWWQWNVRRKRWQYTLVVTDEVLVCQAVVDGGYLGQGFLYVLDLYEKRVVSECRLDGIPGLQAKINNRPAGGHRSSFRAPGVDFRLRRDQTGGAYRWSCSLHPVRQKHRRGLRLDASIVPEASAPALTVISPVDGGRVNVTQKWTGLPVAGRLRAGSRTYRLDDGLAGLDYTQGILGSHTSWRWAQGMGRLFDGRRVGLNLVDGFNDDASATGENALWIGERLIPLEDPVFDYDPETPDRYWTLRTGDGIVDAYFQPYHVYCDERRVGPVHAHFVQPAGRFELRLELEGRVYDATLFGVTEHQDVRW